MISSDETTVEDKWPHRVGEVVYQIRWNGAPWQEVTKYTYDHIKEGQYLRELHKRRLQILEGT